VAFAKQMTDEVATSPLSEASEMLTPTAVRLTPQTPHQSSAHMRLTASPQGEALSTAVLKSI